MINLKKLFSFNRFFPFVLSICVFGCIDSVRPEYEFIDNLIFIDGLVSTASDVSYVIINKSVVVDGRSRNEFVSGAEVSFVNTLTNTKINLIEDEDEDVYVPPANFVALVSETWELEVILSNGKRYRSLPETVLAPVEIKSIKAVYNPELMYRDISRKYVPGHSVLVDFDDPPEENFYYWNFRTFEKLKLCKRCNGGIFRNGECEPNPPESSRSDYYDYLCESECWLIRRSENIKIFSDEFSNGLSIKNLSVADVLLYTNQNISFELQQFTISASAHKYYKVLKDILDNNGSFNAPPPAAFIGNVFNVDDSEEYVLGRFTAAAVVNKSIFIKRDEIKEEPIEVPKGQVLEKCEQVCPPAECIFGPCREVTYAPCAENYNRTSIQPEEWID